jgi:hypothetical protein
MSFLFHTSGSVGGLGGKPPRPTRPMYSGSGERRVAPGHVVSECETGETVVRGDRQDRRQNLVGSHRGRRCTGVDGSLNSGFLYFSLPHARPLPVKSRSCTSWFGQGLMTLAERAGDGRIARSQSTSTASTAAASTGKE